MENLIIDNNSFDGIKVELAKSTLLMIKGAKGTLACAYINVEIADKVNEAIAIVTGVKSFDDMLEAKIIKVSQKALDLGVTIDMLGKDALAKLS